MALLNVVTTAITRSVDVETKLSATMVQLLNELEAFTVFTASGTPKEAG